MAKIGIFYGSSTGQTEAVAGKIQETFGTGNADLINVDSASRADLEKYPFLIFGTPTWGIGDMQDDWEDFIEIAIKTDLKDKKVALFGLGDQDTYPDSFADGVGVLYKKLNGRTNIVGEWPNEDYNFDDSEAFHNGKFVGLILDEENQSNLTNDRIKKWVGQLKNIFK